MKKPLIIACRWLTEEQTKFEELGIMDPITSEATNKDVRFCHIDHYYSFTDATDGAERVAIVSGGKEYVSDVSIETIDKWVNE